MEKFSWQWWVFGNLGMDKINFDTYIILSILFLCCLILISMLIDKLLKGE